MNKLFRTVLTCLVLIVISLNVGCSSQNNDEKILANPNKAILAYINGKTSSILSIGSENGGYTLGLISGSISTDGAGRATVNAGGTVVYNFDDEKITVVGKARRGEGLASIDKVTFAIGSEMTLKSHNSYIYDGEKWEPSTSTTEMKETVTFEEEKKIKKKEVAEKEKKEIQSKSCVEDCRDLYNNGDLRSGVTAEECIKTAC